MINSPPFTIGIYGVDGAGKTTQVNLLAGRLNAMGLRAEKVRIVSRTREEAHRLAWENGHDNAFTFFSANTLAICGALEALIEVNRIMRSPAERRVLLFDRYTAAYAAAVRARSERESLALAAVLAAFPLLDIEFFLQMDIDVLVERIRRRNTAAVGVESPARLQLYLRAYEDVVAGQPNAIILDGHADPMSIHNAILERVTKLLSHERCHDHQDIDFDEQSSRGSG